MKEAMFWDKTDSIVQCRLCARKCRISNNAVGACSVRKNIDGRLYSLVFGKACSMCVDPIEKKPLFHFAPGSQTLSIATVGCNFMCKYCQNFQISQPEEVIGEDIPPERIVEAGEDLPGYSWTYTEPTVFYEYFYETAKLTKNQYHIWVTNGYTMPEAIENAKLNAVNVDYKGPDAFYKSLCSASLEPVLNALKTYKRLGIWIEITNLLIPGHNDRDEDIKEMVNWIADNLGQVPIHFSRFFPYHKLRANVTTVESLERAASIAEKRLDYVYIGNVNHPKQNTYCHNCKALLIERSGLSVNKIELVKKGNSYHCYNCNAQIPVAGMQWSSLGKD